MFVEQKSKPVRMEFRCMITPMKAVKYNLSGLLGNFNADLAGRFYPDVLASRLNVMVSELVNNAVENVIDPGAGFSVNIRITESELIVKVSNRADEAQYEKVKRHIGVIRMSDDKKRLMAETIAQRKALRLKGGLGLIRLAAEIKSELNANYNRDKSVMTVVSRLALNGIGG
ncbi:MAG: hypothetical protein JW969_03535 [Spirochaetales bacterium]|nr:hypothetical protein [Spirochaetales bacterium]